MVEKSSTLRNAKGSGAQESKTNLSGSPKMFCSSGSNVVFMGAAIDVAAVISGPADLERQSQQENLSRTAQAALPWREAACGEAACAVPHGLKQCPRGAFEILVTRI